MTNEKSKEEKKDGGITVGQAYLSQTEKGFDAINPYEMAEAIVQGQEGEDSWEECIMKALLRGKKLFEGDFYVVCLMRRDRIVQNLIRDVFFPRKSCPTPTYDQTVFRYIEADDRAEFLWTLPAKPVCGELVRFENMLGAQEKALLRHVKRWKSGELLKLVQELNNEHEIVLS